MDIKLKQQQININSVQINNDKLSQSIDIGMGKKTTERLTEQTVSTGQQNIRSSSNHLQRHIFNKNRVQIKTFIDENLIKNHISFTTYNKYSQLIHQIKQQSKETVSKDTEHHQEVDHHEQRVQKHKKDVQLSQFDVLLDKSVKSYERTYSIFKTVSLRQKYKHLLGHQSEQQKTNFVNEQLCLQQQHALIKIKKLYRKYRVSNMYKVNVCSKIRKVFVQQLILKGFIKQKNQILSLVC